MSLLSEYRSKKEAFRLLQEELARMEHDEKLSKEIEFEEKLRSLLNEHGKSLKDVIALLDPQAANAPEGGKRKRGKGVERAMKRYVNPHTGEVVETKGGNHKTLKAWRDKYGTKAVDSWLQA